METSMKSDLGQFEENKAYLEQLFAEQGLPLPEFEKTPESLVIIEKLVKTIQDRTATGRLLTEHARKMAADYLHAGTSIE